MRSGLLNFHQEIVEKMEIPDWAKVKCPHCTNIVDLNGIRTISVCLNARNLGDLSVEYYCKKCGLMDTIFFRSSIKNLSDFAEYIKNNKKPDAKPVSEEEMYKLGYNNLVEIYIKEQIL